MISMIVNGEYTSITKTIQTDNFYRQGNTLYIYALGKFSTEQLNEKVKSKFEKLLQENFGLFLSVEFVNNEALYEKTVEEIQQGERKDIEDCIKNYSQSVKEKGNNKAAEKTQASKNSGQGGWKRERKRATGRGQSNYGADD